MIIARHPIKSQASSTFLQEIVHSALHLRRDLEEKHGHPSAWQDLTSSAVSRIVPESLFLFLSVLFGGTDVLDLLDDIGGGGSNDGQAYGDDQERILNIAQDIIFAISKGRKLTPKHVGLGMTLHQATRSEALVDLFHAAGDTVGMDTVRRMDTTIANEVSIYWGMEGN